VETPHADEELEELRLEAAGLRESRKRIAAAEDAERRRLERALHDGVQQQLVGLAANLEIAAGSMDADPAIAKELLVEMREDAHLALQGARRLAQRIYPPLLEMGGLSPALRAAAVGARIPIRIDIAGETTYPPEVAGAVYFCCSDVLERVVAGTHVTVTVRNEDGALSFDVIADGDVETDGSRLRDRVEALGGRLTIGSEDGQTLMRGSLPLT
jgi:signal transduction histidine kinase